MKKLTILFGLCLLVSSSMALSIKYPVSDIADSLKKNARSVVRDYHVSHYIESLTRTRTTKHIVITVLNENGKKHAWQTFSYDNDTKINKVEGFIYNQQGFLVNKMDKKDLKDVSYDPYGTTYSDTRLLKASPISDDYPYTVEYYLEYYQKETYSTPDWFPFRHYNQAIEKSSYELTKAPGIEVSINEQNLDKYHVKKEANNNHYSWTLENFLACKSEPYSPYYEKVFPFVEVVSNNFSYDNETGSYNSWKELGQFYHKLYSGLNWLPEERIQEVLDITSGIESDHEKIKILYKYMQSHTRYISIQVGIGGIQPIAANLVSETGYGDCKALSNYMLALLKAVDIPSEIALIEAGDFEYYFNPNFVKHFGNHAILCVPLENDTIWLECTSQTMPFNYLGTFTDGRNVLLITEDGGKIAKTPTYSTLDNNIYRNGTIHVNSDGNCTATLNSVYTGLEYDDMHRIAIDDKEEQKKALYENYDFSSAKIQSFSLEVEETPSVKLNEQLNLNLSNYASKSGTRLFLPLNCASKWTYVPKKLSARKTPIYKKYSAHYSDTIQYDYPDGYKIEVLPKGKEIDSEYGNYKYQVIAEGNSILYIRDFSIFKGVFPAAEYNNYIKFFKQLKKNDQVMVVLKEE